MSERDALDELRAAATASVDAADPLAPARAASAQIAQVLERIAAGDIARTPGSGLDDASRALLIADAQLTEASLRAILDDAPIDALFVAAGAEQLVARARELDGDAAS